MAAINDVTGDSIQTKKVTDQYRDNYDLIFRKNKTSDNTGVTKNETQDILSTEDCVLDALEAEDKVTRYNEETQLVKTKT